MQVKRKMEDTMPENKGKKKKGVFIPDMISEGDAEGSYTGTPSKECFGCHPVQDADDL